ncbi:MAG TPA: protein kinase [Aggregatilineales bacterium]|nr:protein kinase [Anaerolineales bacterium]HRE46271.1 protein kinase [Aggregatilineales bacterium]
MKRYDVDTTAITPMFNVWGPKRDSKPGLMSVIFDHGEAIGDIEIDRLLYVYRTGALYEAKRMVIGKGRGAGLTEERVLLKVAHNDAGDQLKKEATLLAKLQQERQHPMLPVLLPPYQFSDGKQQRAYGKTSVGGDTKYYVVYKQAEGTSLREMLIKNPQPWYQHAAWITIQLADAIHFIHVKAQTLVMNINPDGIMIRTDKDGIPRPLLTDLGTLADPGNMDWEMAKRFIHPSYIAPELLLGVAGAPFGAQTDVYGLGTLLYEMLMGRPAHPFKLREPEDVQTSVLKDMPPPLNRTDLSSDLPGIVGMAVDKAPARRYPDVRTFAKELRTKFGEVPAERPKRRFPRRVVAVFVAIVFFLIVWTMLMAFTGASLG